MNAKGVFCLGTQVKKTWWVREAESHSHQCSQSKHSDKAVALLALLLTPSPKAN